MNTIYKFGIMAFLLIGVCAFSIPHQNKDMKPDLTGTWRLISFKYGNSTAFKKVPPFMKYRKILTKDHFTWVSYGEHGDDVIGAGGGTYKVKGGKYTETSNFFHPAGTVSPGTSTEFDFSIEGNYWKITGVIKSVKIDPKTGKTMEIEETKLSEVWERVVK